MNMQHRLIYGDNLSPILAHFQKMPQILHSVLDYSRLEMKTIALRSNSPILVAIENGREYRVYVCRGADEEEEHKQEALEIKEGGLQRTLD